MRPRQNPADFLRDWGATTVQADLGDPTSLPAALVGIHTVIDCATARPEESTQKVDWDGKVALIQCAQVGAATLCPNARSCALRDSHEYLELRRGNVQGRSGWCPASARL